MTQSNETEARELLMRHALETGAEQYKGLVTVPLALEALDDALALRDSEKRRADEAEAELARVREASRWQPISDAPESGQILGWVPCERRGDRVEIVKLRDGKPFTVGSEFAFDRSPVTSWLPLPTPPERA